MDVKQLVEHRRSFSDGTPEAISVDQTIEWKNAQEIAKSDAEGNARLVASTDNLVGATQRLGTMTVWLVIGTILMGLAAGTDVVLKLLKVAH